MIEAVRQPGSKPSYVGNAIAATALIFGAIWLAQVWSHGGVEALFGMTAGALTGALAKGVNAPRLEQIMDASFAGLFTGLILSGLYHPLLPYLLTLPH